MFRLRGEDLFRKRGAMAEERFPAGEIHRAGVAARE
jgi:hypothetical protein